MHRLIPALLSWALVVLVGLTPFAAAAPPALAAAVDWREVPATEDGRQWWDAGSLHLSRGGNLSVLSRFQPAGDAGKPRSPDLYVMEVDCGQRIYRDTSVNGLPRFAAPWQAPAGDGLIEAVIEASCAAGSALLQAA